MNRRKTLEERFGWLTFPGLIRAIAMLQLVFFAMIMLEPNALAAIIPNPEKAMTGEWWRLISFVFFPVVIPGATFSLIIAGIFQFFAMQILFMINDVLEDEWGSFRTSLFVYALILCQGVALFLAPMMINTSRDLYLALFFAFAVFRPFIPFMLFLVLPVQVRFLAMAAGALIIYNCIVGPSLAPPYYLIAFLPFYAWAAPLLMRGTKNRGQVVVRRQKFEKAKVPETESLHRCLVCQRTEVSDRDLEFRVAVNGEEYCLDHLDDADKSPAS